MPKYYAATVHKLHYTPLGALQLQPQLQLQLLSSYCCFYSHNSIYRLLALHYTNYATLCYTMLHYATLCYTTTTATTLYNAMLLQLRYTTPQLHLHLRAALRYTRTTSTATTTTSKATRHCTTLGYTAQYYVTIHNNTLHDTNYTTPQI